MRRIQPANLPVKHSERLVQIGFEILWREYPEQMQAFEDQMRSAQDTVERSQASARRSRYLMKLIENKDWEAIRRL